MLIVAPYIVTFDGKNPFIKDGAILINGNIIKDMGKRTDLLKKYPFSKVLEFKDKVIFPGFINIHTHFYGSFARGINLVGKAPQRFSEILESLWWRLDKVLDDEAIRYSTLIGVISGIKSGITTFYDHHASPNFIAGSLDIIADVIKEAGVRGCLCYEVSDRDGEKKAKEGIEENARFIEKCNSSNDEYLKALFGLHASFTLSDKTLDMAKSHVEALKSGYHIHVAEGIEDVDENLSKYNLRVVERLEKNGIINERSIFAHCIHINDNEKEILAKNNVTVAHNPESNLNNAVGVFDITEYLRKNIHVCLGTDGFSQGLWYGLRMLYLLPKHINRDPRVSFNEVLDVLYNNAERGSRDFGINIGKLCVDGTADLIAVPYFTPTPFNDFNILGHIIFGIMENPVSDVMVDGRFLMRDYELITLNEENIMREARRVAERVWKDFREV